MSASFDLWLQALLATAAKRKAVAIHLLLGVPPMLRVDDELVELEPAEPVVNLQLEGLVGLLDAQHQAKLQERRSVTAVADIGGKFRVKLLVFYQKASLAATLRVIPAQVPPLLNLGLPKAVYGLLDRRAGLLVVAGPYSSGRTTTVASIVAEINKSRRAAIVTIEQPIEYVHPNAQGVVEQREIGRDANSFTEAIQAAQEADVDVLTVDVSSESAAVAATLQFASAGRFAILQMPTTTVQQTIEHIVSSFPTDERSAGQLLLAESLIGIVAQRLVPRIGGGLVLAAEVLISNDAIRTLIRDGRLEQLATILQSSRAEGMSTLDQSLAGLVRSGEVLIEQAIAFAQRPESLRAMAKS